LFAGDNCRLVQSLQIFVGLDYFVGELRVGIASEKVGLGAVVCDTCLYPGGVLAKRREVERRRGSGRSFLPAWCIKSRRLLASDLNILLFVFPCRDCVCI